MRPAAASVCGFQLLVYEALSYQCMRPSAASVCGCELLVYAALKGAAEVYAGDTAEVYAVDAGVLCLSRG